MQGHRRRRATQTSPVTPVSPKGGGGTASISLSLLLHDLTDIASSSLRELDAVALATNVMVFMGRDTGKKSRRRLKGEFIALFPSISRNGRAARGPGQAERSDGWLPWCTFLR